MTITSSLTRTVGENDTASSFGEHFPLAASTPFVLGIAEVACHNAIAEHLTQDEITVGTYASIEHHLPSPVGAQLTTTATLVEREGRRLEFNVEVRDGDDLCAVVHHRRAIASAEKIAARLAARSTALDSSDH